LHVRLTCKQKIDREQKGTEHPSGIVKWYVEVFDSNIDEQDIANGEDSLVAIATILTMVEKKQETFVEMTSESIQKYLNQLTEDAKPKWGMMTAQHMVEHLEVTYKIASGELQDFDVATPEKYLEATYHSLYNYEKFPQNSNFPLLEKQTLDTLKHPDLATAKEKFLEARAAYIIYFKAHPEAELKNIVFGNLNRYEWYLIERKHLNHHFEQFNLV
jgi:oxepin-CoA hydrolase/3-oxo-5,6-dehydrosuberyl-CoA semialdehyde dehydrogenase